MEQELERVTERGSSGSEVCAEVEESDGSPNQPMVCATFSSLLPTDKMFRRCISM